MITQERIQNETNTEAVQEQFFSYRNRGTEEAIRCLRMLITKICRSSDEALCKCYR